MKVLITGAAGFTARHLIRRLRRESNGVLVGADVPPAPPNQDDLDTYIPADLTDIGQVRRLVQKADPDWIFNLAGLTRSAAPELYKVNLGGAVNILEVVKNESPEAEVLMVGSAAEYGNWPPAEMPLSEEHECHPKGPYGLSKYAMTLAALDYARGSGVKVIVVRPFNLIGAGVPANLLIGAIVQRAKLAVKDHESAISIGNSHTERDFLAIEDAVDAYVELLRAGHWGQVFNVCSGEAHSVRSVVDTLLSFSGASLDVFEDEALKRQNDPPIVIGDPTKMQAICKGLPRISFEETLLAAWNGAN